jgi:hypothetical protein
MASIHDSSNISLVDEPTIAKALDDKLPARGAQNGMVPVASHVLDTSTDSTPRKSSDGLESPEPFHCVTEYVNDDHILSAHAGYAGNLLPRWKLGSTVTYSILKSSFPYDDWASFAQDALFEATNDWNSRDIGVKFGLVEQGESATFALKYRHYGAGPKHFAESFLPDSSHRIMYVYRSAFHRECRQSMANLFRHEIGHILGLRHEDAGRREPGNPSVELDAGNIESIMNLTDINKINPIHESDVSAVRKLCLLEGESFNGFEIITVDPDAFDQASFNSSDQLSSVSSEFVRARGTDRVSLEEQASFDRQGQNGDVEMRNVSHNQRDSASQLSERDPDDLIDTGPQTPNIINPENNYRQSAGELNLRDSKEKVGLSSEDPRDIKFENPIAASLGENTEEAQGARTSVLNLEDPLKPDCGKEDTFVVKGNPFAFSPGQLNKMFGPTCLSAFYALGGLTGLEMGLRTDIKSGLSVDETDLHGYMTFEKATKGHEMSTLNAIQAPPQVSIEASPSTWRPQPRRDKDSFTDRKRVFKDNRIPIPKPTSILTLAWGVYRGRAVLICLTIVTIVSIGWDVGSLFIALHRDDGLSINWAEGISTLICIILIVALGTFYQCKTPTPFTNSIKD